MKLLIINGPNLNLLGQREVDIYGNQPFEKYIQRLDERYPDVHLTYYQSSSEGDIIDAIHQAEADGIVINPAGYSHTSVAIADAITASKVSVIEVHISNVHGREDFRRNLLTGGKCSGVISGLGLEVYRLAIDSFWERNKHK